MNTLVLNVERFNKAADNLLSYYDYNICHKIGVESFDIPIRRKEIADAYDIYIGVEKQKEEILDTLSLVAYYLDIDSLGIKSDICNLLDRQIREDLLKLYIALYDQPRDFSWISLRTPEGTLRLKNYCNWFMDDMVKDYLREKLPEITNSRQAIEEVQKNKRRRGRIPNDPRLSILMWGTYTMLYEYFEFKSPMPNALCNFILIYLQILEIIPKETDIDIFWIRAQLRYIRSRKSANQSL